MNNINFKNSIQDKNWLPSKINKVALATLPFPFTNDQLFTEVWIENVNVYFVLFIDF